MKKVALFPTLLVSVALISLRSSGENNSVNPEQAFLSANQYTNAFFGFSLPLPTDPPFQEAPLQPKRGSSHVLLAVKTATASFNYKPRLTFFMISADECSDCSSGAVKLAASQQNTEAKSVEIAGREFWRAVSEEKDPKVQEKVHIVKFATSADGYILTFLITSFDGKLTGRLEHNIERIKFFDPHQAREIAGAKSKPYQPGSWPQDLK